MRLAILIAATGLPLFAQNADRFHALAQAHVDSASLRQAADQWEAAERDPARHLRAVMDIARAFLDLDPSVSVEYCGKVRSAPQLWPIMLDAEARLGNWPMAERYGEAVMEEIDAGRLFARLPDEKEEARLRRLYATALEHRGKAEAAARQNAIVDPEAPAPEAIRKEGAAIASAEHARRVANLRSEVLAREIQQPATPFRLKSAAGGDVALADYRGKPVVAVFWATWCAPCIEELKSLTSYADKHPGGLLTISVDDEPSVAARFARQNGYRFPVLIADHSTARTYAPASTLTGANIPQLYVLDARGDIRFHINGFEDNGMLVQEIEWMVAAVR